MWRPIKNGLLIVSIDLSEVVAPTRPRGPKKGTRPLTCPDLTSRDREVPCPVGANSLLDTLPCTSYLRLLLSGKHRGRNKEALPRYAGYSCRRLSLINRTGHCLSSAGSSVDLFMDHPEGWSRC
ncbi:hypothetical protein KM043_011694 [Ampulex compressa]|nr:hypothetical protein KM043_011694 [Ampulex compressa]